MFTEQQKQLLKQHLVSSLETEEEICRIVVLGSFVTSNDPDDLNVAIFQDSNEKYLPLAMKNRRKTREIARMIPMDIIPVKVNKERGTFGDEIERGEVIYERNTSGHST
jgi:hypothetical protein